MPRLTLPPATGTARWLPDAPNGNWQLSINGVTYEVEPLADRYRLYRLDDEAGVVVYDVTFDAQVAGLWSCSCPDAANRPERRHCCKHVMALKAALRRRPI